MADQTNRREISIKDLSTKAVTLYPSRALVVRDIPDVTLQPGSNEIEIYGLTPTADEHSVQVDGRGAATITDLTVELVPNRDVFEDEFSESSDAESDSEDDLNEEGTADVRLLTEQIKKVTAEAEKVKETQDTANNRFSILKYYSRTVDAKYNSPEQLSEYLSNYSADRAAIYADYADATDSLKGLNDELTKLGQQKGKLLRKQLKRKAKAEKEKDKSRARRRRQKIERRKESVRVRNERLRFWPRKLYRVVVRLETASLLTPSTSRRNSMDSVTLAPESTSDEDPSKSNDINKDVKISLSLSYMTREASWSPRYDLNVSSIKGSVAISYRAEFTNLTSETWSDAKIYLSTSQTSYSGLEDTVPSLHTWRVQLAPKDRDNGTKGLLSGEERFRPRDSKPSSHPIIRPTLFGHSGATQLRCRVCNGDHWTTACLSRFAANAAHTVHTSRISAFGQDALDEGYSTNYGARPACQPRASRMVGGLENPQQQQQYQQYQLSQQVQGHNLETNQAQMQQRGPQGQYGHSHSHRYIQTQQEEDDLIDYSDEDEGSRPVEDPRIQHEEAAWEDNGMTATFDIPGTRTLAPSSLTRRHKIATLQAVNVDFSYVAVPKLRNAAFLRAKLRNPSSSITILKGAAGVTLDGSFLGTMTLHRASPGQAMELPLGVDPAVHISYPKPSVHRSTQGIFTKEAAQVFSRAVWLTNTKSTPVQLRVLDQVPVSEDERLRIDIMSPKGLKNDGDQARAGVSAKDALVRSGPAGQQSGAWGRAVATLRKNGEIAWEVKLEKGAACLLNLDYEAKLPSSEAITSV